MTSDLAKPLHAATVESVLIGGDLAKLRPEERTAYYLRVCESVGLNPLTKPFEYLRLNGREVLYATRACTDQLRQIHGVSIKITARERIDDVYVVTASATDRTGRVDESTGAVVVGTLKGEALANALMKAETKAKRRVTLCICGLGMLDESELDTIRDVSGPVDQGYIDERSEAQARHKNESDAHADMLIKDVLPTLKERADVERFCHFNGWDLSRLHTNAKSRLWRALQKRIAEIGVEISAADLKGLISTAPQPEEIEE